MKKDVSVNAVLCRCVSLSFLFEDFLSADGLCIGYSCFLYARNRFFQIVFSSSGKLVCNPGKVFSTTFCI